MTTAIPGTGGTSATTGSTSAATSSSQSLDKNAFLKLLVAQMTHQDPLQPTQGTEYVTQLAQFSALEQAVSQNQKLDLVSTQLTGISNSDALSLVGKSVTVRDSHIAWDGTTATTANVHLADKAASVKVQIVDANGNVVKTMDRGAMPAGNMTVSWDGTKDDGTKAVPGSYSVKVTATGADGSNVGVSENVTATVTGVSFDKGYPELQLDSGGTAPVSDLVSVQETQKGK